MQLYRIATDKLKPNPDNLFLPLPPDEYEDLKTSIAQNGILDPLIVIPDEDAMYRILAGHNRWNIAKDLAMETLPCFVATPSMVGAIADTEVFRRMLTKQERSQYKEIKDQKRKTSLEAFIKKHLLSEIVQHYQEGHVSLELATEIAQWSKDKQSECLTAFVEHVLVECEFDDAEKKALQEEKELLQSALTEKDRMINTLRIQQGKAREALEDKMEEIKALKQQAMQEANDLLKAQMEREIRDMLDQVQTSSKALKHKDMELDRMKDECESLKRVNKDKDGHANAAWVAARMYRDECAKYLQKLYTPETIYGRVDMIMRELDTLDHYLTGHDWDQKVKESTIQDLGRMHQRIEDMLRMLPNSAPPQLPMLKCLQ